MWGFRTTAIGRAQTQSRTIGLIFTKLFPSCFTSTKFVDLGKVNKSLLLSFLIHKVGVFCKLSDYYTN